MGFKDSYFSTSTELVNKGIGYESVDWVHLAKD
jgi:hypothetical protein